MRQRFSARLGQGARRDPFLRALIAKQTGASPEDVGRARAKDIAARSRPGVWVQDESGRWAKK